MSNLFAANRQWRTRPDDERFTSLIELQTSVRKLADRSQAKVVSSRALQIIPGSDAINDLQITGQNGTPADLTHWSFGQVCQLAGAPAGYMRKLPAAMAADCINFGLHHSRDVAEVGILLTRGDREIYQTAPVTVRAATGPQYGRVWDADVVDALVHRFGDGVTGDWRVPGEFGKAVEVTKSNTTIYWSANNMFVFLADEKNRIEVANRRDGRPGSLARGFFVWNSEVGAETIGVATFLFDFVCCNRIVWGAQEYREIRIRHTVTAPDKWMDRVTPIIEEYAKSSAEPTQRMIKAAQEKRIDDLDRFLNNRFTKKVAVEIKQAHMQDEGRPIESLWDAATAVTAYARDIPWQDQRVEVERKAGDILDLAA